MPPPATVSMTCCVMSATTSSTRCTTTPSTEGCTEKRGDVNLTSSSGPYARYQTSPAEDIEKADAALGALDPRDFTTLAEIVAYSQALIALAQVKMVGGSRR